MKTIHKTEDYTLTKLDIKGLILYEMEFHRDCDTFLFSGKDTVIVFPLTDKSIILALNNTWDIKPGELFCLQDTENRPMQVGKKDVRLFTFSIPHEWYKELEPELLMIKTAVFEKGTELYVKVAALYKLFANPAPYYKMIIYGLLHEFIIELYKQQKRDMKTKPVWLPLFLKIEEQLCLKMKSSAELAAIFGMPPKTFLQEFKDYFSCTPKAYPNKKRVEKGHELLMTTDLNVSEISDRLCFANVSKFINEFKLRYGFPPDEYRERYKP